MTIDELSPEPLTQANRKYIPNVLSSSGLLRLLLLIVVWCTTLAFGLVAYDDYDSKWVSLNEAEDGIRFGEYGLAHGKFPELTNLHDTNNNLEIKINLLVEEAASSGFHVLAYIGTEDDEQPLIVGQWQSHIIVMQGYDFANKQSLPRLTTNVEKWFGQSFELKILLNQNRNVMYVNEEPVSTHSPSTYILEKTDTIISIGNTLDGKLGWSGIIQKFSVEHQDTAIIKSTPIANYDFTALIEETQVINSIDGEYDLLVPPVGQFPKALFLNDLKIDNLFQNAPFDLFINFFGFIPLAFCLSLFLKLQFTALSDLSIAGCTLILGTGTSFFIEYVQQYIPGRNSDLHDLVLNFSGVVAGIICYKLFIWLSSPDTLPTAQDGAAQ